MRIIHPSLILLLLYFFFPPVPPSPRSPPDSVVESFVAFAFFRRLPRRSDRPSILLTVFVFGPFLLRVLGVYSFLASPPPPPPPPPRFNRKSRACVCPSEVFARCDKKFFLIFEKKNLEEPRQNVYRVDAVDLCPSNHLFEVRFVGITRSSSTGKRRF